MSCKGSVTPWINARDEVSSNELDPQVYLLHEHTCEGQRPRTATVCWRWLCSCGGTEYDRLFSAHLYFLNLL